MSRLAKDIGIALPEQGSGRPLSRPRSLLSAIFDQATDKTGRLAKDISFAHLRRRPDRPMSLASRSWLLASSPGLRLMLVHRIARWLYLKRQQDNDGRKWLWRSLLIPLGVLKLTLIKINTKSDIANDCEIEGGVLFSDQGNIIFGARKTGAGTVIGTRVTVGMSHHRGRPEIGRNVWIGSDCVVYGAISIGDGATLMPGTVLTKSIPGGVVMRGNPAQLVLRNFDNSELRTLRDADAMYYLKTNVGG